MQFFSLSLLIFIFLFLQPLVPFFFFLVEPRLLTTCRQQLSNPPSVPGVHPFFRSSAQAEHHDPFISFALLLSHLTLSETGDEDESDPDMNRWNTHNFC